MRKYTYANGHSFPVPAEVAAGELARIEERDGGIAPAAVVEEARPDDAALHPCFEWDDPAAAELYRRDQARRLVRSVRAVVVNPDGERQRQVAYVSVTRADTQERAYVSTARAMSEDELRIQVLAEALAQLRGFQRRYGHLRELAGLFKEAEALEAGAA